jgi:molybdate transport system substrate-binding protein
MANGGAVCVAAGPEPAKSREPLGVAAASDLQSALPVLAARFTRDTKIPVKLTFGASGQLAEQIKAGAPYGVFLAANRKFVDDLARGGFIRRESVRPYARGTLVLAVRPESEAFVKRLADLARPEVKKVALANPAFAPYGAAGRQALERSGLWQQLSPKVVQSETVRQALQFVESGNADAGLVGLAIAKTARVRVVAVLPELYDPIIQALGVVSRDGKTDPRADAFARFVLGSDGQAILAEFGFSKPEGATASLAPRRP